MDERDQIGPATLETGWFGLPALGNALAIVLWLRLLFLPPGTVYEKPGPMGVCLFVAAGTLLVSLSVGAVLLRKRSFEWALVYVVFGLTPLFAGRTTAAVICSWRGITVPLVKQMV